MITKISESRTSRKHMSQNVNVNFVVENIIEIEDGITINFNIKNTTKQVYKKDHNGNPSAFTYKNGEYLESIIDDSVVTCVEIYRASKDQVIV